MDKLKDKSSWRAMIDKDNNLNKDMINQQLLEYIKQQLQAGVNKEEIIKILVNGGWQKQDVDEAFSVVLGSVSQGSAVIGQSVEKDSIKIGRFRASFILMKESAGLLKKDKEIMIFPALSAIFSIIFFAIIFIVFFFTALHGDITVFNKDSQVTVSLGAEIVFGFIFYFISFFIIIFFQAGIVTIINGRLKSQDLTFSDGLRNAFKHIGKIAVWALLAATVGMILRAISERSKLLGKIVIFFIGAAWSILTFFIAPILITEELSIKDSLKKSAEIIKKTWGESVIVGVGFGLIFMMLFLLGFLIFIASLFTASSVIIISAAVLLVLYLIILLIISSTLDTVFKTVLYQYANNGIVPAGFSEEILRAAFKKK